MMSGILVLVVKDPMGKNGSIPTAGLSPDLTRMAATLKYSHQVIAIHMNLFLMNMEISSAKIMMVIMPVKKNDWYIL